MRHWGHHDAASAHAAPAPAPVWGIPLAAPDPTPDDDGASPLGSHGASPHGSHGASPLGSQGGRSAHHGADAGPPILAQR